MKIERRDIHESVKVPGDVKRAILAVGGKNPHGEPLYRLLLAQDRVMLAHGAWTKWDDNVELDDRGGDGLRQIRKALDEYYAILEFASYTMSQHEAEELSRKLGAELDNMMGERLTQLPLSTECGPAYVRLYPFEGWIIEKWKPCFSFGSEMDWSSYKFNGENALGPYPHHGEYELVAGPTPHMLTIPQIEDAIRQDYKIIASRPHSPRERVRALMEAREMFVKQKERARRTFVEAFQRDTGAIMASSSLEAGRIRQGMADKLGLKGGEYGN